MTGTVAQIIALTTFGNDFLKNGRIPTDFNSANTTFQFCNKVDFREIKKQFFFSKRKEKLIAENPVRWFEYLKAQGCKHLRLYFKNSKDQRLAKDHKLAGFIGGGGTWLIEAVHGKYSNYWANRWEVTNKDAADNKIWAVNYGMTGAKLYISNLQIDIQITKAELRKTLTEIADFSFRKYLENWGDQFENAASILDSLAPEEHYYHKDLIPLNNYSLTAKQILFAAGSSWVFGGMGSWNDLGFDNKEDEAEYDRLSEKLYANINQAIIAATNSY